MNLHTKLLLTVVSSVLLVFGISQVIQQYRSHEQMHVLASDNLKHEEASYLQMVENLRKATEGALTDFMVAGEMDRFAKAMEAQKKVVGLQEFSVADFKGVVALSTVKERLKSTLPKELSEQLLKSTQLVQRKTADSYEFYQPLGVTTACIECHGNFKNKPVGGVFIYRYNTKPLVAAGEEWIAFVDTMTDSIFYTSLVTALVMLVVLGSVLAWAVHSLVSKPLDEINHLLAENAEDLSHAAEAITNSSTQVATGASSQAAATEEASASLEEMGGMTRRNADDASTAKQKADEALQATEAGVQAMSELVATIKEITDSSQNMAGIIKTIDELAFQTNILALNAAVEAARAGEAGAGFAVVAEEVRALALRSAESAKMISTLVATSIERTKKGAQLSATTSQHFSQIAEMTHQEDSFVKQIARATEEQRQGIDQIVAAVHQIDTVTQRNVASGEETAAAAQQLNSQAQALKLHVQQLSALVHGKKSAD